ncbi:hypothetical protein ABPG74_008909 [Tetrahymena malaccensis]
MLNFLTNLDTLPLFEQNINFFLLYLQEFFKFDLISFMNEQTKDGRDMQQQKTKTLFKLLTDKLIIIAHTPLSQNIDQKRKQWNGMVTQAELKSNLHLISSKKIQDENLNSQYLRFYIKQL